MNEVKGLDEREARISICTSDSTVHRQKDRWTLTDRERGTLKAAAKLALRGDQISRTEFASYRLPYCDDPVRVGSRVSSRKLKSGIEVSMFGPCRKCTKCRQFRQMKWRERAIRECAKAKRSWFVTLTFSALHLAGVLSEAAIRGESDLEQAIEHAAYVHVQRFMKRLRHRSKCKLRYLAVFERGERTGRPHYHMLIHEVDRPCLKQWIEDAWVSHVHCRLVDSPTSRAGYVTKYTTKGLRYRVRASGAYGAPPSGGGKSSRLQKGSAIEGTTREGARVTTAERGAKRRVTTRDANARNEERSDE